MLTREVMGLFALGVLWLNTFLVAAAALARARRLAARRRSLREVDPGEAEPGCYLLCQGVLKAPADGGAVATSAIEQVGRHAAGKGRAILWHDRHRTSAVRGGALEVGSAVLALGGAEGELVEVWVTDEAMASAARCEGASAFEELYPTAKKARGVTRTVATSLRAGDRVWVAGRLLREGEGRALGPGSAHQPLVISTVDPRAWLGRKVAMLVVFAPLTLLGAGLCTAVAMSPPVFDGPVSKAGGLLAFIYFLLVLPAGTRARDASTEPAHRILRGRWDDPAGPGRAPAEAHQG